MPNNPKYVFVDGKLVDQPIHAESSISQNHFENVEAIYVKYPELNKEKFINTPAMESAVWENMKELAESGKLSALKNLKKHCPETFAHVINRQQAPKDETALILAAANGHFDVVSWLLIEGHANPSLKDYKNHDYLHHFDLAAITMAKKAEYEKISHVLEYKGTTLNLVENGESAKQILFAALIDAVNAGDEKKLALLKQSKITDYMDIKDLFALGNANVFSYAIKTGDVNTARKLVTHKLLTNPICYEKGKPLTAVELAYQYEKTEILGFLVDAGADMGDLLNRCSIPYLADTHIALLVLEQRVKDAKKSMDKLKSAEIPDSYKAFLVLANDYLTMVKDQHKLALESNDVARKIDWLMIVNTVLATIQKAKTITELNGGLKLLLTKREKRVCGTRLDYCFDRVSPANMFCEQIALKLNVKQKISDPGLYFSTSSKEVYSYSSVVNSAIDRMIKNGETILEKIWLRQEAKPGQPELSFSKEDLHTIKQRLPSLQELIEYTEYLDKNSKLHKKKNIVAKYSDLEFYRTIIMDELQNKKLQPSFIVACQRKVFPESDCQPLFRLNLFLIKRGIVNHYAEFLDLKARDKILSMLVQYVVSESENASLLELRSILTHEKLNSLRQIEPRSWLGLFQTSYYAHLEWERVQTNKLYAYLEEMIAAQLVKNITHMPIQDPKQIMNKVYDLYNKNGFMSIHRKHDYHLNDRNAKYLHMLSQSHSVEEMQKKVGEKIQQLKLSYK